jgi:hypothetical protein
MTVMAGRPYGGDGSPLGRERRFFLVMALIVAATVATGFGGEFYSGRAVFSELPWQVHLHAAAFTAWIALYVTQTSLVVAGRVALHRRLGMAGAGLAVVIVIVGIMATLMAIRRGATPPFFPPGVFLMLDVLGVLGFAGLTAAAIVMRERADWHRRLMLCGTILLMSPALGRILPLPLLGALAPLAVYGSMMVYLVAGIVHDVATRGRVHPAWWWGAATLTLVQLLVGPLGFSPPVVGFARSLAGA